MDYCLEEKKLDQKSFMMCQKFLILITKTIQIGAAVECIHAYH